MKKEAFVDIVRQHWKGLIQYGIEDVPLFQKIQAYDMYLIMGEELEISHSECQKLIYKAMGLDLEIKEFRTRLDYAMKWSKKNSKEYKQFRNEIQTEADKFMSDPEAKTY